LSKQLQVVEKGESMRLVLLLISFALVFSGCTSLHRVDVEYSDQFARPKAVSSAFVVEVGNFTDNRGEPPSWLGAVRNGYGSPIMNYESSKPASDVFADAFARGLAAHNMQLGKAPKLIVGNIKRLDFNVFGRRAADVEVELAVLKKDGGRVFSKSYAVSNLESLPFWPPGKEAITKDVVAILNRTLTEVVDKALSDSELLLALQQ
jgi:hypothetical protein